MYYTNTADFAWRRVKQKREKKFKIEKTKTAYNKTKNSPTRNIKGPYCSTQLLRLYCPEHVCTAWTTGFLSEIPLSRNIRSLSRTRPKNSLDSIIVFSGTGEIQAKCSQIWNIVHYVTITVQTKQEERSRKWNHKLNYGRQVSKKSTYIYCMIVNERFIMSILENSEHFFCNTHYFIFYDEKVIRK